MQREFKTFTAKIDQSKCSFLTKSLQKNKGQRNYLIVGEYLYKLKQGSNSYKNFFPKTKIAEQKLNIKINYDELVY